MCIFLLVFLILRVKKDMSEIIKEWDSGLSSIEFLHEVGVDRAAVKIGAATTNLEMLQWVRQKSTSEVKRRIYLKNLFCMFNY